MGSRQELPMLVGVPVHRIVEEIRSNTAVVQEGVALPRSPVTGDALAGAFGVDQELEELPLGLLDLLREGAVTVGAGEPRGFLATAQIVEPSRRGLRSIVLMSREES